MDFERAAQMSAAALVAAGVTYYVVSSTSTPPAARAGKQSEVERVVHAFLDAQSKRDLDAMCALVADDILYINEPHPPERAIRSKEMFRLAFADSPCIWCPEAKLQVLQSSHQPGSDTVFVERLDQFLVDGHWLRIPICGYLQVKNGKIQLWKECARPRSARRTDIRAVVGFCCGRARTDCFNADWDYAKYKAFVTTTYGPDFRLFRKTVVNNN